MLSRFPEDSPNGQIGHDEIEDAEWLVRACDHPDFESLGGKNHDHGHVDALDESALDGNANQCGYDAFFGRVHDLYFVLWIATKESAFHLASGTFPAHESEHVH